MYLNLQEPTILYVAPCGKLNTSAGSCMYGCYKETLQVYFEAIRTFP